MRMSCNGCRVLRKGCSENCSIRPCLHWIKDPESQANATVFLAKFYGRAGLLNLINAGPEHLRTAKFRSLLYEACGRIVNPVYGSVGLLSSGNWQLCQAAVEAVLKGAPIVKIPSETAFSSPSPPFKAYDIRHVSSKDESSAASQEQALHKVKSRNRFKRSGAKHKPNVGSALEFVTEPAVSDSAPVCNLEWSSGHPNDFNRAPSHDSTVSHQSEPSEERESRDCKSMFSVQMVEASLVSRAEADIQTDDGEVELELTLGFEPVSRIQKMGPAKRSEIYGLSGDTCKMDMGLDYPA
ncbi:hypothetical protein HHK36_030030 [Tetracentron sinense]|uniref:LOB domain-containing protein n=1 Tax=Tetracentron sinense TaxID=13715 RepID=A0A834YAP5_TETSI|nr:hypothetical protein HHK36_030030 [Tetracentron sinense]